MGQVTPNMGIYIPSAGETNYDAPFAAGMINVDQHDHSGAPNKGVPIATTGLVDGSVTYPKLNANVVDTSSGLGTRTGGFANQITTTGLLNALAVLVVGNNGFLSKNGTAVNPRTMTGTTDQITVANGDGLAGNPTYSLAATFLSSATWMPDIQINGSSAGITYTDQVGYYQKLGKMVFIYANVTLSSKGASNGAVTISNLPVITTTSGPNQCLAIGDFNEVTAANYTTLGLLLNSASNVANLFVSGQGQTHGTLNDTEISNTFSFKMTGVYSVE